MDSLAQPPLRSRIDAWLEVADNALKTLSGSGRAARPCPRPEAPQGPLPDDERRFSAALMRVNHVGEICAQALYNAQRLTATEASMREHFDQAAREETDHLAWTQQRLQELLARPSLLNPLWYAGAFGIGWMAGRTSRSLSLGFVAETERQVEAHLQSHLARLPAADHASRAIVSQMKTDEARHASEAESAGAAPLPRTVRWLMRIGGKVMTTTAHRL
jgi:ubiquinone biosynthesis monooxygenase Coq7